jgi:hypothetical protein
MSELHTQPIPFRSQFSSVKINRNCQRRRVPRPTACASRGTHFRGNYTGSFLALVDKHLSGEGVEQV